MNSILLSYLAVGAITVQVSSLSTVSLLLAAEKSGRQLPAVLAMLKSAL
jgi:hypothetical protein